MKSIVLFNNKGGVGKTTLGCNIGATIANRGSRVLLVDCDPQCNSTLLLMGDEFVEDYYQVGSTAFTVKSILQSIEDGDSGIILDPNQQFARAEKFGIEVVPGHPYLSSIEDILSDGWQKLKSGDSGGIRKTNWIFNVNSTLENRFDYIIYDVGPSLGALNRTVLHGCDLFLTPMGVDIFSLIGIENIYKWINHWTNEYDIGLANYGADNNRFQVKREHTIKHGFLGYTLQQYITKKTKEGERRPTRAYEVIAGRIEPRIQETLASFSATGSPDGLNLGQIPHLYSLVPLAQSANSPIHSLTGSDGLFGSQVFQRVEYVRIIEQIVDRILARLELGVQNA